MGAGCLPEYGDIIGVDRGYHQHYGIFVDDNCVIHCSRCKEITSEPLGDFLEEDDYFICDFTFLEETDMATDYTHSFDAMLWDLLHPKIDFSMPQDQEAWLFNQFAKKKFQLYNGNEVVLRAKDWLEHPEYQDEPERVEDFVFWCKTGIRNPILLNVLLRLMRKKREVERMKT